MTKRVYFENLDGLRFFCFLSVFLFHSFHVEENKVETNPIYNFIKEGLLSNGNLGVNFFFVLSGFLITFLLIEEKKLNGRIDLKNFWLRRILRIWPLFYFCVFFGFVLFPSLKQLFGQIPNETANPIYYLLFINNFDFIASGFPDSTVLGVLWSVAVEEQFYLVWPVILSAFPVRRYWIPFLIIIAGSLTYRAFNDSSILHEHHTLSCIGDMTIGAAGAWLVATSSRFKQGVKQLSPLQILLIYLAFICIFLFRDELFYSTYLTRVVERLFIATVILAIILEQSFSANSLFKMSNAKTVSKLGLLTYGMYCLHFIGILIVLTLTKKLLPGADSWQLLFLQVPCALLLTIGISKLSYLYFEKPFLKLKERFAYIHK